MSLRDYLWPRRLIGQMGVVTALALTAAQVMNVFLLLDGQQLNQLALHNGLAESFCGEAIAGLLSASPEQVAAQVSGMSNNPLMSLELVTPSLRGVQDLERNIPLEQRVAGDLARRGVHIAAVEAGARPVLHRLMTRDPTRSPPPPRTGLQPLPPLHRHAIPLPSRPL